MSKNDDNPGPNGAGQPLQDRIAAIFPGGLPNIYRMISRNQRVMNGIVSMKEEIAEGTLTEAERSLVALEVANHCECSYCTAALSHYSVHDLGMSQDVITAVTDGVMPGEERLDLVISAARQMIQHRGKLSRVELAQLQDRGLAFSELLEIIAVIGEYTIATYAANMDRTRIDPEYRPDP